MTKTSLTAAAFFAAIALAASPAIAGAPIEGNWTNPSENIVVKIAPCGAALCGHAISASARAKGKAMNSGFGNILGAPLMKGMMPAGAARWKGTVFVPDRNIHAPGTIQMINADRIKVSGCVWGLLCKAQVWKRVG
ncbi:DUF2147 domain-containing protein [Sphingomonas sp. RB1R13]|uniref:DUF2147 domain-containing protein n=1 Tax=Sphingomonas sp. RB1R13 TaxID=3096159 RepID=UPI002FC608D2